MKKVVLIFVALLMVLSGVAAVSAYEAHVVDVKAHVENALGVAFLELDFGTVFPQELVEKDLVIGLSESFISESQIRVSDVHYVIGWENKSIADHPGALDPDKDGWFEPIWPFIGFSKLDSDGNDGIMPDTPGAGWVNQPPDWCVAWGELAKVVPEPAQGPTGDLCDWWHVALAVPVFDKWYNPETDPLTPSGILVYADGDYEIVTENICDEYEVEVPHADLGGNMKIQVWEFSYHVPEPGG